MKREIPLPTLLYHHLYPHPTPTDPPSFAAHLSKYLVGEVRIETARFYGGLETVEARYPGLNYSYAPHRRRLSQFPHHARLFRAFDDLGLTPSEIASICRWEGTLWARERYERDEGCKVRDTTGDEIPRWEPQRSRRTSREQRTRSVPEIVVKREVEIEVEEVQSPRPHASVQVARPMSSAASIAQASQHQHQPLPYHEPAADGDGDADMSDPADDEEDEGNDTDSDAGEIRSVGLDLNQRLLAAAAAQAQMNPAEWEQFFKEQAESGALASQLQQLQAASSSVLSAATTNLGSGVSAPAPSRRTVS